MEPLQPIPIQAILAARERIAGAAIRTPLVRLNVLDGPEIYLKLENLQPIGSFKIRGAGNAMRLAGRERLERGRLYRQRRQHGAGRGLVRARCWACAAAVSCPTTRRDQARGHSATGRRDHQGAVRRAGGR